MYITKPTAIRMLKNILEDENVKYYIHESKRDDSLRIQKAPVISYQKSQGQTISILAQQSQDAKNFQIYAKGIGFRAHLFDIAKDELKDKPVVKKVAESVKKAVTTDTEDKPKTRRTRTTKKTTQK